MLKDPEENKVTSFLMECQLNLKLVQRVKRESAVLKAFKANMEPLETQAIMVQVVWMEKKWKIIYG